MMRAKRAGGHRSPSVAQRLAHARLDRHVELVDSGVSIAQGDRDDPPRLVGIAAVTGIDHRKAFPQSEHRMGLSVAIDAQAQRRAYEQPLIELDVSEPVSYTHLT